ncbi:MAG: histidinol-phosphate transaminase [Eubacteriales bacterium]
MGYELNEKIRDLKPYDPISGDFSVRLDANESFIPVPRQILQKISDAVLSIPYNRYPDPLAKELCESFGRYYHINSDLVTAGNGSDELISVICSAFLMKGDTMLTLSPDFSMYRFYASIAEAKTELYFKNPDMSIDVDKLIAMVNGSNAKLVIFSNPCNPTSLGLKREEVRRLVTSVKALVVLDEAYMDFWSESLLNEVESYDNLMILRTCSKAFAMAGIRLGFAVANRKLTNAMKAVKSPYNVNTLTQKAGSVVLQEGQWLRSCIEEIKASRDMLYERMRIFESNYAQRMHVYPSVTNFLFVKISQADDVYYELLKSGIAVRYFGDFLRITAGTKEENEKFLQAFEKAIRL